MNFVTGILEKTSEH